MLTGQTPRRLPFILSLVILFLFAACSSTPSESDGRKGLEDKGAQNNLFKVKSFTKTNGVSSEHTYTMEFKAELECLGPGVQPIGPGSDAGTEGVVICKSKGEAGSYQGKLKFEKTENGWRVKS